MQNIKEESKKQELKVKENESKEIKNQHMDYVTV
jgi:hypothetical protein